MQKVLVGYATRNGAARDIAQAVADELVRLGYQAAVKALSESPSLDEVDLAILGSGINASNFYPEATAWIAANTERLRTMPVAVFNTCLNAADPAKRTEALGYNAAVVERVGAATAETFAGRYVQENVKWWQRLMLKAMRTSEQDHVDTQAAREWAREIARLQ